LFDNNLPPNAKILYGQIKSLTYKNGYCFATNKYFADINKLSVRTISRLISTLAYYKYIKVDFKINDKGFKTREIFITG